MRKAALKQVDDLLSILQPLPLERQRCLASLFCRETEGEAGHRLLPDPLMRKFIVPTIDQWKKDEPNNPEPLRWTGILNDLIRAVEIDPSCDQTRQRLISKILGFVGYWTHELPVGYLGTIDEDYELLKIARREANLLREQELRDRCLQAIDREKDEIDRYRKQKEA